MEWTAIVLGIVTTLTLAMDTFRFGVDRKMEGMRVSGATSRLLAGATTVSFMLGNMTGNHLQFAMHASTRHSLASAIFVMFGIWSILQSFLEHPSIRSQAHQEENGFSNAMFMAMAQTIGGICTGIGFALLSPNYWFPALLLAVFIPLVLRVPIPHRFHGALHRGRNIPGLILGVALISCVIVF
jgi:putative Mn2+ efflux pump MntP